MPDRKKGHVRNRSTGSSGSAHSDDANNVDETSNLFNNDHNSVGNFKDLRKQSSTSNLNSFTSVSSLHSISSQGNSSLNTSRDRDRSDSSNTFQLLSPLTSISSLTMSLNSRRKIYLLIGITAFVLVLLETISSFISIKNEEKNRNYIGKVVPESDKFTIVLNTFKRHDMLSDALSHYSQCPQVKHIHVIWCEAKSPPNELLNKYNNRIHPKIHFDIHKDSLNSRFLPLSDSSRTDGILTVDDDMRISCDDLVVAHAAWMTSPKTMVGFMPRTHLRSVTGKLLYRCWWSVWWRGKYSIILTKAAFLHHDYFRHYSTDMPAAVREYVHKNKNCEDIAMQFLVANVSSLPPVFIRGSLEDLGVLGGISTQRDPIKAKHISARSACLNDMTVLFGGNPLKYSRTFVERARNIFGNAPSTWWEFISSDMWSTDHGDKSFLSKLDTKSSFQPNPVVIADPPKPSQKPETVPVVPAPPLQSGSKQEDVNKKETESKKDYAKNDGGTGNNTSSTLPSKSRRRRR